MIMLFQLLDWKGAGAVPISSVVKSMREVAEHMDAIPRKALLMCENDTSIVLDYPQFSSLVLNVLSASTLKFHQIANLITLSLCSDNGTEKGNSLANIFQKHNIDKISAPDDPAEVPTVSDTVQKQRIARLFDLWDLDHSGYLELSELVLGLRKFNRTKDIDATVKECVTAMRSFDDNNDQRLDEHEFATFLARFASTANVSLEELVDFMIVEFVTKDTCEEELDSVRNSIKAQARAMDSRESSKRVGFGSRRLWTSLTRA
jgi:Ca2+-binding EF-hand superfamily protein